MTGHTECGDDVLVGYECRARFADGTVDTSTIHEPKASNPDGVRALAKYLGWRALYAQLGAAVHFQALWLPRDEAIAQGFLTGRD